MTDHLINDLSARLDGFASDMAHAAAVAEHAVRWACSSFERRNPGLGCFTARGDFLSAELSASAFRGASLAAIGRANLRRLHSRVSTPGASSNV